MTAAQLDIVSSTAASVARSNPADYSVGFLEWINANQHVWAAFEREAMRIVRKGYKHYSARTVLEYLRHHSNVAEAQPSDWKINNNYTPDLARLWATMHPRHAGLFSYRTRRAI